MIEKIKENFPQFAIQKFSSNVIEKCVERADEVSIHWPKILDIDH